jgi:CHAT domain-containing protein
MNACELGYSTKTLADYGGMAGACLCSGSRGFIAPLWSVDDKIAHEIAVEFYNNTMNNKIEVSEVLRRLRSRFDFKADNPEATYLAYIFYGHPKLILDTEF